MASINRQDILFQTSKIITHPDAIKISVESLFNIYDKDHDGRISKS